MQLLQEHKDVINKLCVMRKVERLYAFGSVLTERFNQDSDIDLIVSFKPIGLSGYADNYYNLKDALERLFQKPVDLLEEQAIKNPYFKNAVEEKRQLIYG